MKIFLIVILSMALLVGCSNNKKVVKTAGEYEKAYLSKATDVEKYDSEVAAFFGEDRSSLRIFNNDDGKIYSISLFVNPKDLGEEDYYLDGIIKFIISLSDNDKDIDYYSNIKGEMSSFSEKCKSSSELKYSNRFMDSNIIMETDKFYLEQRIAIERVESGEFYEGYDLDLYLKQ